MILPSYLCLRGLGQLPLAGQIRDHPFYIP